MTLSFVSASKWCCDMCENHCIKGGHEVAAFLFDIAAVITAVVFGILTATSTLQLPVSPWVFFGPAIGVAVVDTAIQLLKVFRLFGC